MKSDHRLQQEAGGVEDTGALSSCCATLLASSLVPRMFPVGHELFPFRGYLTKCTSGLPMQSTSDGKSIFWLEACEPCISPLTSPSSMHV